jgi:hypothetical protein
LVADNETHICRTFSYSSGSGIGDPSFGPIGKHSDRLSLFLSSGISVEGRSLKIRPAQCFVSVSALDIVPLLEKVVDGEIGDWGGLENDGRWTESHDAFVSVGDMVR